VILRLAGARHCERGEGISHLAGNLEIATRFALAMTK
jgi:hypothetical protein